MILDNDTIAAIATPAGKGGIGIIRLSGDHALSIGQAITKTALKPRYAHFCRFYQLHQHSPDDILDEGIVLYFKSPHSFTGEDIVELQAHGGPVVLDAILNECLKNGARLARPGEFSERAFLNNKIDLAQAEAIADLIDSTSIDAAKNAIRSMQGNFSKEINDIVSKLVTLRIYIEAAIDFPEEEVDFLANSHVESSIEEIENQIINILDEANQGLIRKEGITIVIAGKPNAGKSSLLNALAKDDMAIVTDIEGTTRDTLKQHILVDGLPVHIIDTAGLRESLDIVEQEGIKRALQAIEQADAVLYVIDITNAEKAYNKQSLELTNLEMTLPESVTIVRNKCDINGELPSVSNDEQTIVTLSAKTGDGIDLLRKHIRELAGYRQNEGGFTARRRHLDSLNKALESLQHGKYQLQTVSAGELLAEDLRICQQHLNEITGEFSSDDLLGEIFSHFCIGK